MKKSILTIIMILITNSIFCQSDTFNREKIEAYKKLYLSDKLKLDPKTENEFWITYKSYEDSLRKLNRQRRQELLKLRANNFKINNEDYPKMIDNYMYFEKRKVELRGELISQLKEIMSVRKTLMLFRYEEDFRREMIAKLRKDKAEKSK